MRDLRLLFTQREFAFLVAANVVLGLAYSVVLPFLSIFGTQELGLGPWGFSLFMAANALAGILVYTRIARWSDTHFPRKTVLLVGAFTGAAYYAGYAYFRDIRILLALSWILGGIAGGTFSQTFALARDLLARQGVPEKEVPFYINVFRLCYALAWTVGPALGAWILERTSFTASFLAAAGLFLLFGILVQAGVVSRPPTAQARAAAEAMPMAKAMRLPGFLAHFIAFVLLLSCSSMGMMNLPLLILGPLAGSEAHVGVAYSIAPVFELPFMFYAGVLAMRLAPARIIRWSAVLAVVYYGGLALAREPWHVYPLQVLSAALVAVTSGLAITFFQDFLPGQAGTATNVYSNAGRIGAIAGYLLFGSLGATLGYRSVFAVCAVFCAASWLIMRLWPPRFPAPAAVPAAGETAPSPAVKTPLPR